MSEFDMTDEVPAEDVDAPEEYEPNEEDAVSESTGTVYDDTGAAEKTPQDEDAEDAE